MSHDFSILDECVTVSMIFITKPNPKSRSKSNDELLWPLGCFRSVSGFMEGWCFVATLASSKGSGLRGWLGQSAVANARVHMVRLIQNTWFIATVVPWTYLDMNQSSVFFCFGDSLRQTDSCPQVYDVARTARFLFLFKYVCFILAICTHLH